MQDNEKKPALRFKGFTDPWEQRKLGEIAVFSKGVGYSKNDLCEEGTPIILYGRLYTKYETCVFDVDTFVKEKAGSVYSKGGEVIVPASGETAEDISIASVVVKPGILLGGDLNIVSPTAEYDSAFLALTISSGATHKYLSSLAQGKSVVHLHNSDIQSVSAKFPTKREQEKIHLIFGKIDTLITLHQRKYEKLVNIKKSMLDKMFPKNGASVPEIRFKGFTALWEQRKFGEVVDKYEDPVETPHDGYYRLGIRSHAKGTFHSYVEKGHELETAQMYRVAAGNFIVNITFGWEHAVAVTNESDAGKLVSHRFPQYSFHDDMLPEFFKYVIADEDFRHWLWLASPGGAGRNRVLKLDEMLNYEMVLPSKEEQQRIAAIFRNLDTLITLHQREHIKPILEVKRVKRNE